MLQKVTIFDKKEDSKCVVLLQLGGRAGKLDRGLRGWAQIKTKGRKIEPRIDAKERECEERNTATDSSRSSHGKKGRDEGRIHRKARGAQPPSPATARQKGSQDWEETKKTGKPD